MHPAWSDTLSAFTTHPRRPACGSAKDHRDTVQDEGHRHGDRGVCEAKEARATPRSPSKVHELLVSTLNHTESVARGLSIQELVRFHLDPRNAMACLDLC